jgi:hypothetical protein
LCVIWPVHVCPAPGNERALACCAAVGGVQQSRQEVCGHRGSARLPRRDNARPATALGETRQGVSVRAARGVGHAVEARVIVGALVLGLPHRDGQPARAGGFELRVLAHSYGLVVLRVGGDNRTSGGHDDDRGALGGRRGLPSGSIGGLLGGGLFGGELLDGLVRMRGCKSRLGSLSFELQQLGPGPRTATRK